MKVNNRFFFVFAMVFSLTLAAGGLFAAHANAQGEICSGWIWAQHCPSPTGNGQAGDAARRGGHKHRYESPAEWWYSPDNSSP